MSEKNIEIKKQDLWTIGTLKYTLPQLLFTATILLLAKQMMCLVCYSIVPTVKPIILDEIGATPTQIALIVSTLPNILNIILNPILSTWSDKTRTRFGRRTPFLILSAPFLALMLILIAFHAEGASLMGKLMPGLHCNWELWYLGITIMLFQIGYLFPGTAIYYLEADVIPYKCFGQYMAVGSIVSTLCSSAFSYWLLKFTVNNLKLTLSIFAAMYLVAYILQLLFVKEGEYPPVEDKIDKDSSIAKKVVDYCIMFFRQCFTRKIFIFLSLCTGLNAASNICRSIYNTLFVTKDLGLDLATVGKIGGICGIITAICIYFFGRLMDKTHPMLIYFLGGIFVMIVNVFGYFFCNGEKSYFVIALATALMYAFQNLANTPLMVAILPKDKFGQFASSNGMVNSLTLAIGSFLGGIVTTHFGFRVMFVWDFFVTGLATFALVVVYFEWKRFGGKNYVAPQVD